MEFIAWREDRKRGACAAAAALRAGDRRPARALLSGWRFAQQTTIIDGLLDALIDTPPRPASASAAALLAPASTLPPPAEDRDRALWLHWEKLVARLSTCAAAAGDPLAWGLHTLGRVGEDIDQRLRAPWRQRSFPASPLLDEQTRQGWLQWLTGNPFLAHSTWGPLFEKPMLQAFGAVLSTRGVGYERRRMLLREARDALLSMLLGGASDTPPGWLELAVRVLETAGGGPVQALSSALEVPGWRRVSLCAVRRGHAARTASALFPQITNPVLLARAIASQCAAAPDHLDTLLDAHVARRLIARWSESSDYTTPARDWTVVRQNRARARARLRAALSAAPPASLLEQLLALDSLHARTLFAARRYARDWAWIQVSRDFSFGLHPIDPLCLQREDAPPFDEEQRHMLQTWVLLVILKGHLARLEHWIRDGSAGSKNAGWERLKKDALPASLKELDSRGHMVRGQRRLRAELSETMDEFLATLQPTLAHLAALPDGPDLPQRFCAVLDEQGWHSAIKKPGGKFYRSKYHPNAIAAAARLRPAEEQDE